MTSNDAPAKRARAAEPIAARITADLIGLPTTGKDQKTCPVLQVFIFHQDHSAGLRAKAAFDHIGRQLNLPRLFDVALWRIALLEDLGLRREAANIAARADIIFLSLDADCALPPGLRAWLPQWAVQREQRPCVLVASFDERHRYSAHAQKVLDDLHGVAAQRGLEVIPHFDFTPPETGPGLAATYAWNPPLSSLPGTERPRDLSQN